MYTKQTIPFLKKLAKNNNREWFNVNKQQYEDAVRGPALAFIENMAPALEKISPYFDANTKKVGGSLMRVYRDTRFSADKTPYKTNIGVHFRHVRGKDVHAPGFYVHVEPKDVFIGAGIWHPESSTLKAVRQLMDEYPDEWRSIVKKVTGRTEWEFSGESLKRPPKGYDKEHPLLDDLKRKDYIVIANLPVASITEKDFHKQVAKRFKQAAPLVKFLCEADDLLF